jgi:transcriptional regulator with XRE-family HTH domain
MPTAQRLYDRGTQLGERHLAELGEEFKRARLVLGLSQQEVADAARVDRADYSRIERHKLVRLSIVVAARIGAALGLDVSVKAFPSGVSIRDAGQARRLKQVMEHVGPPLTHRREVPLPRRADAFEGRSWDLCLFGHAERTTIEFEVRMYDLQAQERRLTLKLRDDPANHFLLIVADTESNRRVLAEFGWQFCGLKRLRTATVLKQLERGEHPQTGFILLGNRR